MSEQPNENDNPPSGNPGDTDGFRNEMPNASEARNGRLQADAAISADDQRAENDGAVDEGGDGGTVSTGFGVRDLGEATDDVTHPVAGRPYDPDRAREWVRGSLAVGAFVLFAVFALGLAWAVAFGDKTWDDVEGMSGTLLPAIVSVVGTTTGFYFGTRAKGDG